MIVKNSFLSVLLLLLVTACTSTPTVHRYVLQSAAGTTSSTVNMTVNSAATPTIGIGKMTLPAYLDRAPIVHRKGNKLLLDEYQIWAEPLTDAVPRALVANLALALPTTTLVQLPWPQSVLPKWRLLVRIERFEAVDNRAVEIDARWSILDVHGKTVQSKKLALEEPIPDGKFAGDDLSDVVAAHSAVLTALSKAISEDLAVLTAQ